MIVKYYPTLSLAAVLIAGPLTTLPSKEALAETVRYSIAVNTPGSAPYNIGVGLSSIVSLVVVPENGPGLAAVSTDGHVESLEEVAAGRAQLAIVDSVAATQARDGLGSFQDLGLGDQLMTVATLWQEVDHFILASDRIQSGTISDLASLSSQDIAMDFDNHTAPMEILARFGAKVDGGDGSFWSEWDMPLDAFERGEISGFAVTAPPASPDLLAMLERLDGRAELLEVSRRQMTRIDDGWHAHRMTPDDYPGLATSIDTPARTVMLVASTDAAEDDVYEIVKAMFENLPMLINMDATASQISLDQDHDIAGLLIHPGAARYYQEVAAPVATAGPPTDDGDLSAAAVMHASHADHGSGGHAGHSAGQQTGESLDALIDQAAAIDHIHDEAMLARARAEIHDGEEVLKIGRPAVLRHPETEIFNVYFGLGKTEVAEHDVVKIRGISHRALAVMQTKGREPEIYVEGHTDSTGAWELNYEIAHKRAQSVKQILMDEGIPPSWIHISDYSEAGLAVPTADNVAEERNRRVEITIIPQG